MFTHHAEIGSCLSSGDKNEYAILRSCSRTFFSHPIRTKNLPEDLLRNSVKLINPGSSINRRARSRFMGQRTNVVKDLKLYGLFDQPENPMGCSAYRRVQPSVAEHSSPTTQAWSDQYSELRRVAPTSSLFGRHALIFSPTVTVDRGNGASPRNSMTFGSRKCWGSDRPFSRLVILEAIALTLRAPSF